MIVEPNGARVHGVCVLVENSCSTCGFAQIKQKQLNSNKQVKFKRTTRS